MECVRHRVGIKAAPGAVFEAVHLPSKLVGWWAARASGTPKVGSEIELEFPGYANHVWQLLELKKHERVRLACKAGPGPWLGTELRFDLDEARGQVYVTLRHSNLEPDSEASLYFNTKWPVFLLSLKAYLETGTGHPFPNDIKINHD